MPRWAKDRVMAFLESIPDPIGPLASAFSGETEAVINRGWIDKCVIQQTT